MTHNKKTVAIICDKNPYTSFGRMTLDLQTVLSEKFSVHIIWLITPKYFPADITGVNLQGSHKIHAPSLELGWLQFRRPLRRLLSEIRPDNVLMIRPELGFLIREVRKALPKSWAGVFVHDMFAETLYSKSLKFKLINKFFINPTREADGFLYNSEYTRNEAHKVMGLDPNGPIVGCPFDRSVFRPLKETKITLKQKWELDKYKGVCLHISLDEPRKNIATFFTLAKHRPDIAFVRVGPSSPWMKKWIDDNLTANIIHHSKIPQEQLLELYGCADLFIYPSYLEGFGMPPLEALACGVPAVAANTSALKENLDGIVPLVDPADCVDGYLKIIDDVLSGKNIIDWKAAEKLLDRFSIENFGDRVCSHLLK
jgi:glycosyltransferase involved in cell wall biosynthesis